VVRLGLGKECRWAHAASLPMKEWWRAAEKGCGALFL
jgi:hypothetical protein